MGDREYRQRLNPSDIGPEYDSAAVDVHGIAGRGTVPGIAPGSPGVPKIAAPATFAKRARPTLITVDAVAGSSYPESMLQLSRKRSVGRLAPVRGVLEAGRGRPRRSRAAGAGCPCWTGPARPGGRSAAPAGVSRAAAERAGSGGGQPGRLQLGARPRRPGPGAEPVEELEGRAAAPAAPRRRRAGQAPRTSVNSHRIGGRLLPGGRVHQRVPGGAGRPHRPGCRPRGADPAAPPPSNEPEA
jgi:hypothetical protein